MEALTLARGVTTPGYLEVKVRQAEAYYAAGLMDLCAQCVECAMNAARQAHNHLRLDEALDIFLMLQARWSGEKQVKQVGRYVEHVQMKNR